MSIRLKVAAAAAGLAAVFAFSPPTTCSADQIKLQGGKTLPRDAAAEGKVQTLAYDTVKVSGQESSAGLVVEVSIDECTNHSEYAAGETAGEQGYFDEAAASFGRAAEELKKDAKQLALYMRALSLAQLDDFDAVQSAIDSLVAEFPKTYFLYDLQSRKARGLLAKGDAAGAQTALDAVINAPGMNKRDLYAAELEKIHLFKAAAAGKDKEKLAAAEAAFRALLDRIEKDTAAKEESAAARLRAQVGIGRMLVFQGKPAAAKPFLEQVIDASGAGGDASMLAGAYAAFGHVMYEEARVAQAAAGADQEARKRVGVMLEGALLHYLRVTELYGERAERSDLYDARVSAARVFQDMFKLTNETDCEAGKNALRFFSSAMSMLGSGMERSGVAKEIVALKPSVDKACAKPAEKPAEKPAGKPPEPPR